MSNYIVTGEQLTSIADAIRAKSGGESQLAFPAGFVSEVQSIDAFGDYEISQSALTIYETGTFIVPSKGWLSRNFNISTSSTGYKYDLIEVIEVEAVEPSATGLITAWKLNKSGSSVSAIAFVLNPTNDAIEINPQGTGQKATVKLKYNLYKKKTT